MTAAELLKRFLDESPWVNRETTVDRIIDGNPDKELKRILVVWRASMETLQTAVRDGYDGIVVHEPTYYFHRNEATELAALPDGSFKKETALAKQRLIRGHDLAVIRIHDCWDSREGNGIAAEWAKSLGLTHRVHRAEPPHCECRYDMPPTTAARFLATVREAVKDYQTPLPVLFGDPDAVVSRVGLGAGCIGNLEWFLKTGCDIAVVCDDGLWYWMDITFALDRGFPVIRVSHAASEEAGIQAMAAHIQDTCGIETVYIPEKANRQV